MEFLSVRLLVGLFCCLIWEAAARGEKWEGIVKFEARGREAVQEEYEVAGKASIINPGL
jgi:hypothetical protein